MVVLNDLDRFHLVADVIDRVPGLGPRAAYAQQAIREKLIEHTQYIARYGEDMPRFATGDGVWAPPRDQESGPVHLGPQRALNVCAGRSPCADR
jgi:hypothetical protein